MSYSGDAAEQVVRMSLETGEVAVRLAGSGAKQLAILIYAILREQKKTAGKARLTNMLRSGKELKVFAVKDSDLQLFCREAKKYGVLYCVLKDRDATDGLTDIMARAEDAGKINRIIERFGLATVDMAQVKQEIEQSRVERRMDAPETPAAEPAAGYLSSVYGTITAILLCCVLAVLIFAVFNTAMRQKNQLGMMMGCGCGIVFLINFSINILENLGVLPQSVTFLPFLSAGGSCIIVSYGLMGIVLSTYRYKNIYPRHLKIGFKFDKTKARKALYVSKMSMCIWTGGTVAVMCIAIYWDLCKGYMNIPFKIITMVLTLLLVGNMRKIVQYNEMNR